MGSIWQGNFAARSKRGNQIHACLALEWNETKDETPLEKRSGRRHEDRRQVWWLSPDDRNWLLISRSVSGGSIASLPLVVLEPWPIRWKTALLLRTCVDPLSTGQ